jgi:hypothetical protein
LKAENVLQKRIDMKKTAGWTLIIFLFTGIQLSCSKFESDDPGSGTGGGGTNLNCNTITNKSFSADVNPIIQTRCATNNCHAAGSTNGPGPLTSYAEVFAARDRIRTVISQATMPIGSSLTTAQRSYIICWVDSGAPNN